MCERTIRFCVSKALHEFVADIACIEVGEDEHIGFAGDRGFGCFRGTDFWNDRCIELKLAVQ